MIIYITGSKHDSLESQGGQSDILQSSNPRG